MDSCTLHGRLQDNNEGAAREKIHLNDFKGPHEGCAGNLLIVVVCSGWAFLLISRDLASGTRCQDLVMYILFSKKFKERDGKHLVP